MFDVKDFEFFKNHILSLNNHNGNYVDLEDLQEFLKHEENFQSIEESAGDSLAFDNDPDGKYWDIFKEWVIDVLNKDIVEITYEIDDEYLRLYKRVSQVGEKYFYSEYTPNYGGIDEIQEVFPTYVTVQAFKFPSGFVTNDELDIIE